MRFSFTPDREAIPEPFLPDWKQSQNEGQLALDVFRRGDALVIRSTMAGVKPEDVDIAVNGDLLTIRGQREHEEIMNEDDWFHRECYWGSFSRSLILPVDVYAEKADASLRNGILEVRIPIRGAERHIPVR
ncbi:Hsp20/alpha crystallin family protein [Patescibacteria group bacterium]|jgi:HSP20 family protein|nr:Hsp20/alpha crystallin family protein [Patescibacteria group bacterium]